MYNVHTNVLIHECVHTMYIHVYAFMNMYKYVQTCLIVPFCHILSKWVGFQMYVHILTITEYILTRS
jgi:hypothetical protein